MLVSILGKGVGNLESNGDDEVGMDDEREPRDGVMGLSSRDSAVASLKSRWYRSSYNAEVFADTDSNEAGLGADDDDEDLNTGRESFIDENGDGPLGGSIGKSLSKSGSLRDDKGGEKSGVQSSEHPEDTEIGDTGRGGL